MAQSLSLSTPPPSAPSKRQRSREPDDQSRPGSSAGQAQSIAAFAANRQHEPRAAIKIPAYLLKTKSELFTLFQELEWKQRFRLSHALNNPENSPFRVDRSFTVISRNRYGNVQPWDAYRVKLKEPIGGSDYVNASPIVLKSRTTQLESGSTTPSLGGSKPPEAPPESTYIATQGPKDGQFSHFWHMVMQQTVGPVGVIVMLTQLYEGSKEKCGQYFPMDVQNPVVLLPKHEDGDIEALEAGTRSETLDDGDPFMDPKPLSADTDRSSEPETLSTADSENASQTASDGTSLSHTESTEQTEILADSVNLISLHHDLSIASEVRHMKLTIGSETKDIYHYLFTGWPDFGKPEAEDRQALVELLRVSRKMAQSGGIESGNPRYVHCSAGVGRTGTFIALDFLVSEVEAGRVGVILTPVASSANISNANGNGNENGSNGKESRWGKSGSNKKKVLTPDLSPRAGEKSDLVFETVNTLREQRMMMVMNELQFCFIYEVLKEVFVEWAGVGMKLPVGVEIRGGDDHDDGAAREPVAKVPRIAGGDTRDESLSEAETDIISEGEDENVKGEMAVAEKELVDTGLTYDGASAVSTQVIAEPGAVSEAQHTMQEEEQEQEQDPYAVVAPDKVRRDAAEDL